MHTSLMIDAPCELINVVPFNPLISRCQIKVCYVGESPNRNRSVITKDVALEMAKSLPGSPIVGFYNEATQDFEEHNKVIEIANGEIKFKATTRPYGFVDLNARMWFQQFLEDGIVREYLVTEGWLWTGQFPEAQRVIERGNNQSMELDENFTSGSWTRDENGDRKFFIINEAIISKLCILGENVEPCFEGAQITKFSLNEGFKNELFSLINQMKEILEEGGTSMAEVNTVVEEPIVTEEPVVEEPAVVEEEPVVEEFTAEEPAIEEEPVIEEPIEEPVVEEEPVATYNLEEIVEYVELQNQYNALQEQYNAMVEEQTVLNAELQTLKSFKLQIERQEKQTMIDSFETLSAEEKQDVVDNIDTYSLDEIEGKLSVIFSRKNKKVVVAENEDGAGQLAYSFTNTDDDNNVPAWIKAIRDVVNND